MSFRAKHRRAALTRRLLRTHHGLPADPSCRVRNPEKRRKREMKRQLRTFLRWNR